MKKLFNNIEDIKESFSDTSLLELALTHRSWVNENTSAHGNNERMEFLGDAILEFVVSSFLYKKFADKEEGFLTALRANIVNTQSLGGLAKKLGLGPSLKLSKGEEQGNGRENESLLADTVEAIIGALYIDGGLKSAKSFIDSCLLANIEEMLQIPLKDSKSRLQEVVQARGMGTPKYSVVSEVGPDHDKEFEVEVAINGQKLAKGTGKSKSRAEQAAATAGLVNFEAKR